jgi:hypothetical protein
MSLSTHDFLSALSVYSDGQRPSARRNAGDR